MKNKQELLLNYFSDLMVLIKDMAFESKREMTEKFNGNFDNPDYIFYRGKTNGYYEMISLMQQQAEAFGIPLKDLNLDDIDADKDLM